MKLKIYIMASITYSIFFLYIVFHIGYFYFYFDSNTFQIFLKIIEFVFPGIFCVLDK